MKKLFAVLLTLSMLFALAACGATDSKDASVPDDDQKIGRAHV